MTTTTAAPSLIERIGPGLIILGTWLMAALMIAAAWLVSPQRTPPGMCEALGLGCTLPPKDAIVFFIVYFGLPTMGCLLVLAAIISSLLAHYTRTPWWARGLIAAGSNVVLLFCVVVLALLMWFALG